MCKSNVIKVMSSFNGKILCYNFNEYNKNHVEKIGNKEVSCFWADFESRGGGFGSSAEPITCVYVIGDKEYEKELAKHTLNTVKR